MLEVNNIHKIFKNGKKSLTVLKGVDLNIKKGEFVAIVGPSGAGKSTLLHILGGLDSPSQGQVIFQGADIYSLGDSAISRLRNQRIGFVFQFYHLLSEFTVLENVLMPALINLEPKTQNLRPNNAIKLLEQVGLAERVDHFPSQLSGGERQRAAIVRGLINKPNLLLCDEPTGNLDSKAGNDIIGLIKKANTQDKMTVVLVTHNLELAKAADRIYHLSDGKLVN
ncbi:MAG: ABC transporter ATP-binding protein [Candidatus Omnitrophica bacterium]|nr:ABC transporter ATP-binding protein [Candidatus Omnitrophota bacterium]